MPRKSPFDMHLSGDERLSLESMARKYTSPYCDVIRAKIILLADEGLPNDLIAAKLDTPRQIVSKWRKRFALSRLPGLEAQPRGGRKARFSPPASSSKLRRWPANSPTASDCLCHASPSKRSGSTSFRRASSRKSAAPPCGVGSVLTLSAHGNIEAGSSPVIPTLRPTPVLSSTSTSAFGRAHHWARMTSWSQPTRRRAFKLDAENGRLCRPVQTAPSGSSMRTFAKVPGPAWRLGTFIAPRSSDAAKSRMAWLPQSVSSVKS